MLPHRALRKARPHIAVRDDFCLTLRPRGAAQRFCRAAQRFCGATNSSCRTAQRLCRTGTILRHSVVAARASAASLRATQPLCGPTRRSGQPTRRVRRAENLDVGAQDDHLRPPQGVIANACSRIPFLVSKTGMPAPTLTRRRRSHPDIMPQAPRWSAFRPFRPSTAPPATSLTPSLTRAKLAQAEADMLRSRSVY